uniref:Olfactory receptor n=1 Tax=Pyxicephalus adspersus TaxID=30357 RepID=A0AAV3B2Z2_PYXAD|nr:TPA: hypothetical protein GDO54_005820 [Pyxicephalus adspersus]
MDNKNVTIITAIHLLGFQTPQSITLLVFFLFLIIYCVTLCGNILIITLVSYSRFLRAPMYFFLSQLAVSDILISNVILPNMLHGFLMEKPTMLSIYQCIIQFCFFAASESLESLLLTLMSYDRYLAICRPFHYTMIMSYQLSWITIITSWSLSFLPVLIYILTLPALQFCGPNIIDHFYCDLEPILQLSCSDTTIVHIEATSISVILGVIPFFLIILSYFYFIITIFKIPSLTGRQKAFSTCSSHLTVVSIFYGTILCVYLVPRTGQTWNISKFVSLLYTVVTPLLNPIIYSLRNKELKQVQYDIFKQSVISNNN